MESQEFSPPRRKKCQKRTHVFFSGTAANLLLLSDTSYLYAFQYGDHQIPNYFTYFATQTAAYIFYVNLM